MHFCEAKIALSDDSGQVVDRGLFNPVSWPEIQVIQFLHGEGSVREARPFVSVRQSAREEKERLTIRYGAHPVNECFTGRPPRMELEAPEATIAYGAKWCNPLSNNVETIEDAPPIEELELKLPLGKGSRKAAESGL